MTFKTLVYGDETGDSETSSLALRAPPHHSTAPTLGSWSEPGSGQAPGARRALPHLTCHSCKSNTQMEFLHRLDQSSTDSTKFVWDHFLLHIKTYGNP